MKTLIQLFIIRWRIPLLYAWAFRAQFGARLRAHTKGGRP